MTGRSCTSVLDAGGVDHTIPPIVVNTCCISYPPSHLIAKRRLFKLDLRGPRLGAKANCKFKAATDKIACNDTQVEPSRSPSIDVALRMLQNYGYAQVSAIHNLVLMTLA